jgi:hypothetical protein
LKELDRYVGETEVDQRDADQTDANVKLIIKIYAGRMGDE